MGGFRRGGDRRARACILLGLALACADGPAAPSTDAPDIPDAPDAAGSPDAPPPPPPGCLDPGGDGATSPCLQPRHPPARYVDQGQRYFDTLDADADPKSVPDYAPRVARWEWPPWLKLTGYERDQMLAIGDLLRQFDPSKVLQRDCRAFAVQPFGRCHVVMAYGGGPCPIYEEFTFNDQGQVTFIEAWSDVPGQGPAGTACPPGSRAWATRPGPSTWIPRPWPGRPPRTPRSPTS